MPCCSCLHGRLGSAKVKHWDSAPLCLQPGRIFAHFLRPTPFHDVKNSLGYLPLSVVSFTSMQALHPSLSKWTLSPVGSNLCQALIAWLLLMGHPGLLLNTSWAHGKKIPLSMIRNHRRRGWGWKVVGNRVMWESDWARWGI